MRLWVNGLRTAQRRLAYTEIDQVLTARDQAESERMRRVVEEAGIVQGLTQEKRALLEDQFNNNSGIAGQVGLNAIDKARAT